MKSAKIESGPNYITGAHAFVTAMLRLGLRAPLVACNNNSNNNNNDDDDDDDDDDDNNIFFNF